jgi:hypothetical protein
MGRARQSSGECFAEFRRLHQGPIADGEATVDFECAMRSAILEWVGAGLRSAARRIKDSSGSSNYGGFESIVKSGCRFGRALRFSGIRMVRARHIRGDEADELGALVTLGANQLFAMR